MRARCAWSPARTQPPCRVNWVTSRFLSPESRESSNRWDTGHSLTTAAPFPRSLFLTWAAPAAPLGHLRPSPGPPLSSVLNQLPTPLASCRWRRCCDLSLWHADQQHLEFPPPLPTLGRSQLPVQIRKLRPRGRAASVPVQGARVPGAVWTGMS